MHNLIHGHHIYYNSSSSGGHRNSIQTKSPWPHSSAAYSLKALCFELNARTRTIVVVIVVVVLLSLTFIWHQFSICVTELLCSRFVISIVSYGYAVSLFFFILPSKAPVDFISRESFSCHELMFYSLLLPFSCSIRA